MLSISTVSRVTKKWFSDVKSRIRMKQMTVSGKMTSNKQASICCHIRPIIIKRRCLRSTKKTQLNVITSIHTLCCLISFVLHAHHHEKSTITLSNTYYTFSVELSTIQLEVSVMSAALKPHFQPLGRQRALSLFCKMCKEFGTLLLLLLIATKFHKPAVYPTEEDEKKPMPHTLRKSSTATTTTMIHS